MSEFDIAAARLLLTDCLSNIERWDAERLVSLMEDVLWLLGGDLAERGLLAEGSVVTPRDHAHRHEEGERQGDNERGSGHVHSLASLSDPNWDNRL